MIHFDARWVTIRWDADIQAVHAEWKGYSEGKEIRAGLDAGCELLRKKRARRWLADLRKLGPIRQEDQRWMYEVWFPRAIALGLRWMALVEPRSAVARMSVSGVMSRVDSKDIIQSYFDQVELARGWLAGLSLSA